MTKYLFLLCVSCSSVKCMQMISYVLTRGVKGLSPNTHYKKNHVTIQISSMGYNIPDIKFKMYILLDFNNISLCR